MNILLILLVVCLFFFIMNNKEGFVQNYNYPVPYDDSADNTLLNSMKKPNATRTYTLKEVQYDLNLFNNASNILYGMQRIPLPNLPILRTDPTSQK